MRSSSSVGGIDLWDVDTRLGKMLVEEIIKRDRWERECEVKRGEWYRLEGNYVKWEGESNERERELNEFEGKLREQERELIRRESEICADCDREFKVFTS